MRDEDFAALGLQAPPTRIDPPVGPRDVASLIERAAAQNPDGEAVVDAMRRINFKTLAQEVEAVAALFDRAGIRPGDRIAASLGNDANIIIGFFAAMRLGAIWVGINKILPAVDKQYILTHSGAALLLTDSSLTEQVVQCQKAAPGLSMAWYLDNPDLDGGWNDALANAASAKAPRPDIDPFAPAAIMYTSGTTGVPKGVVHSQHNLIVPAASGQAHNLMAPNARRGSALPLTITNVMVIGPITAFANAQPFLFAPSVKIEPLVEWLHRENIGQIAFVPTMVYDLLQADLDLPDGMKLGCGGAPLPHVIRDAFKARYGYEIMTSYGLTEAPTVVAQPQDQIAPEGSSGRALPHFELTIRNTEGAHLPTGETGEVCFGPVKSGPWANVYTPPLGYWMDAEKTAALLKDGVVHSGDHGRLDADGWLTIADRSSELILRGGSNVYPAEIERVLHMHDDVADCAVVGKPDLRMGMLTVACIQPARSDINPDELEQSLRSLCAEHLTRYKIPDHWRFMESFPRNAMGKVVKPKLREMVVGDN